MKDSQSPYRIPQDYIRSGLHYLYDLLFHCSSHMNSLLFLGPESCWTCSCPKPDIPWLIPHFCKSAQVSPSQQVSQTILLNDIFYPLHSPSPSLFIFLQCTYHLQVYHIICSFNLFPMFFLSGYKVHEGRNFHLLTHIFYCLEWYMGHSRHSISIYSMMG